MPTAMTPQISAPAAAPGSPPTKPPAKPPAPAPSRKAVTAPSPPTNSISVTVSSRIYFSLAKAQSPCAMGPKTSPAVLLHAKITIALFVPSVTAARPPDRPKSPFRRLPSGGSDRLAAWFCHPRCPTPVAVPLAATRPTNRSIPHRIRRLASLFRIATRTGQWVTLPPPGTSISLAFAGPPHLLQHGLKAALSANVDRSCQSSWLCQFS